MKLWHLFAEILEYPTPLLFRRVEESISLLVPHHPEAAEELRRFGAFLDRNGSPKLEEIFTSTFDLQPACYPYVGYHLFGEDYRRGLFMARLKEHYRTHAFFPGQELPDHLAVMLRFLAERKGGGQDLELVQEGMIPALERMIAGFLNAQNPYRGVLQALLHVLNFTSSSGTEGRGGR